MKCLDYVTKINVVHILDNFAVVEHLKLIVINQNYWCVIGSKRSKRFENHIESGVHNRNSVCRKFVFGINVSNSPRTRVGYFRIKLVLIFCREFKRIEIRVHKEIKININAIAYVLKLEFYDVVRCSGSLPYKNQYVQYNLNQIIKSFVIFILLYAN